MKCISVIYKIICLDIKPKGLTNILAPIIDPDEKEIDLSETEFTPGQVENMKPIENVVAEIKQEVIEPRIEAQTSENEVSTIKANEITIDASKGNKEGDVDLVLKSSADSDVAPKQDEPRPKRLSFVESIRNSIKSLTKHSDKVAEQEPIGQAQTNSIDGWVVEALGNEKQASQAVI
jgi:hypothetical protein